MIKAVLLDLDNTLLLNPDARFAAEYIRALDAFFREASGFTGAAATIRQIMDTITGSTGAGTQTNLQQMLAIFAAHTGQTPAALAALFEAFYTRVYPSLAGCVQPVAGANDLIQRLVAAGLAVVIATNPIYPETAIRQRMTWAGLPQSADLYALITTADVMHFAKPDAAYYAEIVARVGVEPDEALLIGDSLVNDIVPAGRLGLSTYHITPAAPAAAATAGGTLADFARLIQADDWRHRFQPRPLAPEMIVPQYRGNIGALHGLLTEVRPDDWHRRPLADEWSILQILCHMRDSESTQQRPRLERILREDDPFLIAPRPPGPDIPVCAEDGHRIAAEFVQERARTMAFVHTLTAAEWQRPARHSIFGRTTLLEMAHFTAQHDRLHLNQLCQTIGRCH